MSRWLPDRLRPSRLAVVGLDGNTSAWREAGTARLALASGAAEAIGGRTGPRQWLLVAGLDLAVHWVQSPPAGLRSLPELRQVAAVRCAALHGGDPQDWWVAGDWNARRDFVCSALPRTTANAWLAEAGARGVRLRWLSTWLAACSAKSAAVPPDGWSALRTPSRVITWHCRQGRVNCVFDIGVSGDEGAPDLARRTAQQIRLACLRQPHLKEGPVWWPEDPALGAQATEAQAALYWGELAAKAPA